GECLERGEHPGIGRFADLGQDPAIGAQLRRVHHEGRAVDPGKVEMGEGPRIAGARFHQPNGALNTRNAPAPISRNPAIWLGPGLSPNSIHATSTKVDSESTS